MSVKSVLSYQDKFEVQLMYHPLFLNGNGTQANMFACGLFDYCIKYLLSFTNTFNMQLYPLKFTT